MRVPAPVPVHPIGSLVIYETMPLQRVAHHLFAVLGEVKPDLRGRPQTTIQALCRRMYYGKPADLFIVPQIVLTASLTPVEDYGRLVELSTYAGTGKTRVKLHEDAGLPHIAGHAWGNWPFQPVYEETAIDDAFLERIVVDHYRQAERRAA